MLLDLFLIGLIVTVEPLPLSAMILLLAAERGLLKGLGFLLGWLLTLVGIVALTVAVTGGEPLIPKSAPSTAALAVKLLAGAARRVKNPSVNRAGWRASIASTRWVPPVWPSCCSRG